MLTFQHLEKQLREKAHAAVSFSIGTADFTSAIEAFLRFLSLPSATKDPVFFKVHPTERGSEVGYRRYRRDEGQTDDREYFHYHRLAEERFHVLRGDVPELDTLLKAMKHIHDEALLTLEKIIDGFNDRFPGITQKFFSNDNPGDFYLRFLKYDRAKPGEFLAKGHYDRGSCTLALAESAPGLRIGTDDLHLKEVEHREGEALFFPGLKFSDVTSNAFHPAWHDVIQKGDAAYSEDIARWAIVFFADAADLPSISYDEAHTPLK